jgi:uncharacterized small protein (DUF1192 family)
VGQLTRANADAAMCDKCTELDRRIGHLRKMIERLEDAAAVEAATKLIEEMDARKAALHPEQQK